MGKETLIHVYVSITHKLIKAQDHFPPHVQVFSISHATTVYMSLFFHPCLHRMLVNYLHIFDTYSQEMFDSTSFIIINIQVCCLDVQKWKVNENQSQIQLQVLWKAEGRVDKETHQIESECGCRELSLAQPNVTVHRKNFFYVCASLIHIRRRRQLAQTLTVSVQPNLVSDSEGGK